MQISQQISLNTLRAFIRAAEKLSLKDAAADLGVTAGAVSHQVKSLEDAIGTTLFARKNNAVILTAAGDELFRRAAPGLQMIEGALQDTLRGTNELTVHASTTLALRWLVPNLPSFRARRPDARIKFETLDEVGPPSLDGADLAIAYHRQPYAPEGAELLVMDVCRPYLAPDLLARHSSELSIEKIPALQTTENNWDWDRWMEGTGRAHLSLAYADSFDLDDVALRAALAGMGMILAPEFMVRSELEHRRLCALPDCENVPLGCYAIHPGRRETGLSRAFVRWLKTQADTSKALDLV